MQTAGEQFNLAVARSSVDDAEKVAADLQQMSRFRIRESLHGDIQGSNLTRSASQSSSVSNLGEAAEQAVHKFLLHRFPGMEVVTVKRGEIDFLVQMPDQALAVWVKAFRKFPSPMIPMRLRDAALRVFYEISKGMADDCWIFLVMLDIGEAAGLADYVFRHPTDPQYHTLIAFIDADDELQIVGESEP